MTTAAPHRTAAASPALAAEDAVLGAMIQSRLVTEEMAGLLTAGDFAGPSRGLVFDAAVSLAGDGEPVDPASVFTRMYVLEPSRSRLAPDGLLLATLIEQACPGPVAAYHAGMIRSTAKLHRLGEVASRLAQRATSPAADPEDIIDAVREELDALLGGSEDGHVATVAELFGPTVDSLDRPPDPGTMVPTGLADLDAIIPGLRPGQLVIIGARPSTGKSTLALDIARHAALKLGYPVLFASVEMDHEELMYRLIAAEARVSLETMLRHELAERDWQRIKRIRERVMASGERLVLDDAPDTGLARLRVRLRRMAASAPARLLIVDYLQLLRTITTENRQQAVADLSRGLKLLAREFGVPVVVCAQLNRAPEQRHDKRPVVSDLRESGAIEADSDVVLLLHREDLHDSEKRPGEMDVIVAKHRQGRLGVAPVAFLGEFGCCADLARAPWSPSSQARDAA